ncbi:MAG TPA: apolipoprotein N-acyltransferase [Trebonia sp.]|nr:apolipoprotein N-acyltransferase [Trebonia sp.]
MIPVKPDAELVTPEDARPAVTLKLRWSLLIALAGGLLLAISFPPVGIWPLVITGPALLAVALSGRSLRASFLIGLVFGVAFFFPLLSWVLNVAWYAWVALAAASTVILAVFTIGQRVLLRVRGWPVAVAGWWVALEAFRDRWPWGGFPWGRLAMSQAGAPTAGWAALGGEPFLTFVLALTGAMLAWLVLTGIAGRWRTRRTALTAVAFVAVAAVAAGVPAALTLDPVSPQDPTAELAAVQGDVPRGQSLATQLNDAMVTANHADATINLANQIKDRKSPKPDLVIWPENSTDLDPLLYPQIYDEVAGATDAVDAPLLVGELLEAPLRNAGQLWLPGTGPTNQVYVKRQLVPFGEYIPFRSLLQKITPLTALQPVNFTAGHKTVVFHVNSIRLGDVICYEIGFDNLVRSEVNAGANLLAVQTNDATFEWDGQTGETGQQLAMARMRAVESDRAVVVASTTGYSAIIAPDGQLIEKSGTWRQTVLEAKVPLITYTTLADRVGPWPEYIITILTAIAFAAIAAAGLYPALRRRGAARSKG